MLTTREEILAHSSSPILVLAGPGSGKTQLLADKIKALLDGQVDKDTVMVLTYNQDTRQNLYERLVDSGGTYKIELSKLPVLTTMHSLGYEIIRRKPEHFGLKSDGLNVQENEDVKSLIFRDAALLIGSDETRGKTAQRCKQHGDCNKESLNEECRICDKYWELMSIFNRVDFDDQVLFACQVLEDDRELLSEYQARSQHLLIDEYQDINAAQFRLIKLLSAESRSGLFVVGDDAQSIYGFRGCDPKFILEFKSYFPGAETPPWPYSHRCHEKTMNDACSVLEKHYHGWKRTELQYTCKEGKEAYIRQWPSEEEEAIAVAKFAKRISHENKSVLILAPKKELFNLITKKLSFHKVAFTGQECLLPKYVDDHVDSINIFLKWIKEPKENFYTRRVIEELMNHGSAKVAGGRRRKGEKEETRAKRVATEREVAELWNKVGQRRGLFAVLKSLSQPSAELEKIKSIMISLIEDYTNDEEVLLKHLFVKTGIWEKPSILARDLGYIVDALRFQRPAGIGRVQLMSMRKAKGLGAEIVIIVGLENDLFPNPKSKLDEEARLFYVSLTRAVERVYLFHSWRRTGDISYRKEIVGKKRSIFLDDIGRPSIVKRVSR
jgi:DNA helicase-2/ATP-dependent DNA helicase PcrA